MLREPSSLLKEETTQTANIVTKKTRRTKTQKNTEAKRERDIRDHPTTVLQVRHQNQVQAVVMMKKGTRGKANQSQRERRKKRNDDQDQKIAMPKKKRPKGLCHCLDSLGASKADDTFFPMRDELILSYFCNSESGNRPFPSSSSPFMGLTQSFVPLQDDVVPDISGVLCLFPMKFFRILFLKTSHIFTRRGKYGNYVLSILL